MCSYAEQGWEPGLPPLICHEYWGRDRKGHLRPNLRHHHGDRRHHRCRRYTCDRPEDATPKREGRTAASLLSPPLISTYYRLGLHSSHIGGGAMLNPIKPWLL